MSILTTKLSAACNCGKLMQDNGEWPVTFPNGFTYQARRFSCEVCKTMISLVDEEGE